MSVKNRYVFFKRSYPQTIILFKKEKRLFSYGEDKQILENINFKNINDLKSKKINYLIVKDLNIIHHQKFKDDEKGIKDVKINLLNVETNDAEVNHNVTIRSFSIDELFYLQMKLCSLVRMIKNKIERSS